MVGSSTTGNKGELDLRFRDPTGDREVLVIGPDASAWNRSRVAPGDALSLVEWSGKIPAIDLGTAWIQTEDYPTWDAFDLAAPGIALFVTVMMLLYARELKGMLETSYRLAS